MMALLLLLFWFEEIGSYILLQKRASMQSFPITIILGKLNKKELKALKKFSSTMKCYHFE